VTRNYVSVIGLMLLLFVVQGNAQTTKIDKVAFFEEVKPLDVTLVMNIPKLLTKRSKQGYQFEATLLTILPDSTKVKEPVSLEVRGNFRRENCYLPPLKINFKGRGGTIMAPLGSLKLVNQCEDSYKYNEYLLKEYLTYRIFNLITDKSFRVRLINLRYADSAGKKKPIVTHAFLLEDSKAMAKRNNMVEWGGDRINTEGTNRQQMTLVSVFEFMIGNTDWSVPVKHNIRLMVPKDDSLANPFAVPYDFDYCGLINAEYAIPSEVFAIRSVTERVYRGFPRTMEELQVSLNVFKEKKADIYALIEGFELLPTYVRREMTEYLNQFYLTLDKPNEVRGTFIDGARRN
jgi:hypothetical protein